MSFIVESFSGPAAGRKFDLPDAVTVTFGRTDKARFVIPEDKHLSSAHFSLECRGEIAQIRDSSRLRNGTFLMSIDLRVTAGRN